MRGRINDAIRHLATRQVILDDGDPDDDPFVRRTFPLVTVGGAGDGVPYRDKMPLQVTAWGEYHVRKLLEQTQYWKHMFYQIVLPFSLAPLLDPAAIHGTKSQLRDQLERIFDYLTPIESSWLYGLSGAQLEAIGVWPIMGTVRDQVLHQLR